MATQATIDDLINQVAQETTLEQSVITLLDGIAAQVRNLAASRDPKLSDKLNQLAAQIFTNKAALNAAIQANTSLVPTTTPAVHETEQS